MYRGLYTWLLRIAVPLASLQVLWRGLGERAYWRGWRQRFGFGFGSPTGPALWIHAVSLGEVQAALILARALRSECPGYSLLLTAATPAGCAQAAAAGGLFAQVCYAPYDLPGAVRRVLRAVQPACVIILETELWPNQLHECARAGVPVHLASARVAERTARRLAAFPGLLSARALANLSVSAQSAADARRFQRLGVPPAAVQVCGNLKFDGAPPADFARRGAALRASLGGAEPIWVAGSTRAGEEGAVLAAHQALRALRPRALLVLAPRHRERFDEVAALVQRAGLPLQRRSAGGVAADAPAAVLLLDTLGELADFYAAADLAFVGGSLVPLGGHNLLEPAALGVATLTGPHHTSAPDILRVLAAAGGVGVVRDASALQQELLRLVADPAARAALGAAARAAIDANRGALAGALRALRARLGQPPEPRPAPLPAS